MSFSQSSSPTLMKEQYQKKENEKQRIIEKVGSEHVQPTKEEQDYATDVIKIISEQFSEDLITKNLDDLDAPIRRAIAAECEKLQVTFEVQKRIEKTVGMMVLGNGPIEEYLQDPEVTEIVVQRYDNIVVERHGKVEPVPTIFNSEAHLQTIIKRIVQKVNRQINIGHPIVDARLQDGSRVNATIPPVSPDGATLTIRKFSQSALTGADYVRMGSMNRQMLYFLTLCVKGRLNIFVSGGTGTGKTTMLNMLSSYIAENDLIITIEDTLELKLQQKNVRRMEVRLSSTKDMEMVDQKSLVKAALRQRPDRIILGEIRDESIIDLVSAMSTGHEGSMSTIHANSPRNMCDVRIPILYSYDKNADFSEKSIALQIAEAVQIIVQLSRFPDGSRKITAITEVDGLENSGKLRLNDIFLYDRQRKIFHATGNVPKTAIRKIRDHGISVDETIFQINVPKEEIKT